MSFLPDDFVVPRLLETSRLRLRPLMVTDAEKDLEAVMSSRENLWKLFGEAWGWPAEGLTLEEDRRHLKWHEEEFERRSSFDYVVVALDESEVIGCVYVDPPTKEGFEAEISYWVSDRALAQGLEEHLSATIRPWISEVWPFKKAAYPGRDIPWAEWNGLPDSKKEKQ